MNHQLTRHGMRRFVSRACPFLAIILVVSALALVSGCAGGTDIGNPEGARFSSDAALKSYIAGQYAQSALPESLKADITDDVSQPVINGNPQYAAITDYSRTTVQESGVDESDKVKTDGIYIYVAGTATVHVVIDSGKTAGLREAARIPVNGSVDSLYLYGPTLVILYTPENGTGNFRTGEDEIMRHSGIGIPEWLPVNSLMGILTVDVHDPENPMIRTDLQADGSLVSSRLAGNRLHVVTQFLPDLPPLQLWHDGTEAGKNQTMQNNQLMLETMSIDDLIPDVTVYDASGQIIRQGRLVDTENFLKPENPDGGSVVAVITIDLANHPSDFTSIGFIADVQHVYASKNTLYLTASRYDGANAESDATGDSPFQTVIHQLDISGAETRYAATGSVPGRMLDPYAISEFETILRIATLTGNTGDGTGQTHIFCIERQGTRLTAIGRLDRQIKEEPVYDARFAGKNGFLFTPGSTDPLLALDLSDPEAPSISGYLLFQGVAAALYPLSDRHLMVIGKSAAAAENDEILYQGVRIALYDVSDIAAPKLLDTQIIGDRGAESEALYNYKAMTFQPEKRLLALPVALFAYEAPPQNPVDFDAPAFNSLYIYEITENNTLKNRGRIPMTAPIIATDWLRGVFTGDRVFAVSADAVTAATLPGLTEPFDSITLGW